MQQLEIEYKILLTKTIFFQILDDYQAQIHNHYIQINHYLTHPLLEKKKYMLRIREKNDEFELTLKRPLGHHRIETNIDLTKKEKEMILNHQVVHNDIMDILREDGIPQVELENQFSLTTHRYDIVLPEGTLSLDDNRYLGKEDYELEFEVDDEQVGYQKFLNIIKPYSLTYETNCDSKIKRVLDSL